MGRGISKAGQGTAKPAPAPAAGGGNSPTNAKALTDREAAQLRKAQDSAYDGATTAAVKMYISNTDFDSQGHSLSQTMNYLLDNGENLSTASASSLNRKYGLRLTDRQVASMNYTNQTMQRAAHNLGRDTKFQRGAHDDLLQNVFAIKDYSKMSESQLKSRLVGQTFQNTSHMSMSYDIAKNPFIGNGPASGGREVVFNISAGKNTKVMFGAKKQSEVVAAVGQNWQITDVRYTGKTATPRGKGSRPQIEIDIETY